MPSFGHLAVHLYAFLVGIVESEACCIGFEPVVIFVGLAVEIKRISFSSSGDRLDIYGQSRLMFARAYLRALYQGTSLLDEIILQSSASVRARYIQSVAAERVPEMPCHIGELDRRFLPQLECFGNIRGEIGIDRDQIRRYIRAIIERMFVMQEFLERIVGIEIESWSLMFHSEAWNDFVLYRRLDISGIYEGDDTDRGQ